MLQLIKDPCGARKILKTSSHILGGNGTLPNRKSTSQKEVNNKIHAAYCDLYRKSFPNYDSPKTLPQHRPILPRSSGQVSA